VTSDADTLTLRAVGGPEPVEFIVAADRAPATIGRRSDAACRLDDPTVSREHAVLRREGGGWVLEDAGSRAGTLLNGAPLRMASPLAPGDEIGIGPWRLAVAGAPRAVSTITLTNDRPDASAIRTSPRRIEQPIAAQRLTLLLEYADRLHHAEAEPALAAELLTAACRGAECAQGLVVKQRSGGVAEVLARRGDAPGVSRTVLEAARQGSVVRLRDAPELMQAQSLMTSGVRDVLCVPVAAAGRPDLFLYLVSDREGPGADAEAFCVALVRLAEIAISGLRRRELEREIQAAREAQERILPSASGTAPGLRYAMLSRAGRGVAGDLFDVVAIDERRAAVLLGDITGKGAGAGLLMTAAQAFLNSQLRGAGSLEAAVAELNAYLNTRTRAGEFLTLWIGVYDHGARELEFVDAGHGYAVVTRQGEAPATLDAEGGPPLGIGVDDLRRSERLTIGEGDALYLYSDGLVEQRNAEGTQFGVPRVMEILASAEDPEHAVARLAEALDAHAGPGDLADDLTLAAVSFTGG